MSVAYAQRPSQFDEVVSAQKSSLASIGLSKLDALGRALGFDDNGIATATSLFEVLTAPWADLPLGDRPPWPNDLTDDGTPFELSVAINNRSPELRMLLEPQLLPVGPRSNWEAGLQLHERLARRGLISTERFDLIADLFQPLPGTTPHFSLWTAALLRANARPLIKAYTNPQARGRESARALVREALERLQLPEAIAFLDRTLGTSSPWDVRYFALDMDADQQARVKVYVASSESSDEVAELVRGTSNIAPEQAQAWLSSLTGRSGPFNQRPVLTCFAFTAGTSAPTATLHVPIRCYVSDDEQAAARIGRLLSSTGRSQLRRALSAVSERPLSAGRGLLTYASLRPDGDELRVTIYLAPETYSIAAPRRAPVTRLLRAAPARLPAAPCTLGQLKQAIDEQAKSFGEHEIFRLLGAVSQESVEPLLPRLTLFSLFLRDALMLGEATAEGLEVRTRREFETNLRRLHALVRASKSDASSLWPFDDAHDAVRAWAYARISEVLGLRDAVARKVALAALTQLLSLLIGAVTQALDSAHASANASSSSADREQTPGSSNGLMVSEDSYRSALSALDWAMTTVGVVADELVGLCASRVAAESAVFQLSPRAG